MFRHDLGFVDSITGWLASNRIGSTSVNAKFIVKDWSGDAACNEKVPVTVDDVS